MADERAALRCRPELLLQVAEITARRLARHEDALLEAGQELPRDDRPDRDVDPAFDLYGGPLGSCLAWGALARHHDPQGEWASRCHRLLDSLRSRLKRWMAPAGPETAEIEGRGLGIGCGLGAPIYVLTCVGQWLGEPTLIDEAEILAEQLSEEGIARDRSYDVIHGSAGALLAVLALAAALRAGGREDVALLEKARRCARHLLENRRTSIGGHRAWVPGGELQSGALQSGFSHGAAGIAYALERLAAVSGDAELSAAAAEAIAFEGELRDVSGGWLPHEGFDEPPPTFEAWCWGSPGITLARLAGRTKAGGVERHDEVIHGLERLVRQPQTLEDHLCCGNFGRALILTWAASSPVLPPRVDGHRLLRAADTLVYRVLGRFKRRRSFGWSAEPANESFQPFFFKGAAGIVYALLYLADPDRWPMPLLFEPPVLTRRSF